MERLRRLEKSDETICYPAQYENAEVSLSHISSMRILLTTLQNWKAHEKWTGPQILKQLPEVDFFSTTVGTGGIIDTGRLLILQC